MFASLLVTDRANGCVGTLLSSGRPFMTLPTLAAASVAMLCVLACLFAFSGAIAPLGGAQSVVSLGTSSQPDVLTGATRSLLTAPPTASLAEVHPSTDSVQGWAAAADAVQDVVPSAEFVCNRSSCFALRNSEVEAAQQMHPFAVKQAPALSQDAVNMTMMSTLRDLALALEDTEPKSAPPPAEAVPMRTARLRGVGQMQKALPAPAYCKPDGCTDFEQLADSAMSGAGLIKPGTCRLVYNSDASTFESRRLAAQQGWGASTVRTRGGPPQRSSGRGQQAGETGFVLVDEDRGMNTDEGSNVIVPSGHASSRSGTGAHSKAASDANYEQAQVEAPVVSVMLPVKRADAQEEGVLTQLHHVYVVVAHAAARRMHAYECELAQPVYA